MDIFLRVVLITVTLIAFCFHFEVFEKIDISYDVAMITDDKGNHEFVKNRFEFCFFRIKFSLEMSETFFLRSIKDILKKLILNRKGIKNEFDKLSCIALKELFSSWILRNPPNV